MSRLDAHRLRDRSSRRDRAQLDGDAEANGHDEVEESSLDRLIDDRAFDESVFTAFQLATFRGPLCAEPMTGLTFFVERLEVSQDPTVQEQRAFALMILT